MPCKELTTSLPSSLYKSSAVPLSHNGNHARPLPLHGRGGGPALSLSLSVSPPLPAAAVRLVLRPWASPTAGGGGRGAVAGAVPKRETNLWAAMGPPARPARSLKNKPPPNGQNGTPHHQVAPQRSRSSLPRPGRGGGAPSYLHTYGRKRGQRVPGNGWMTPEQVAQEADAGLQSGKIEIDVVQVSLYTADQQAVVSKVAN